MKTYVILKDIFLVGLRGRYTRQVNKSMRVENHNILTGNKARYVSEVIHTVEP